MGKTGTRIVELDIDELIKDLNGAMAAEWLAAYQYWLAAQMAEGIDAPTVADALKKQVQDELKHAERLAQRVIELGGTPTTSPSDWPKVSSCPYRKPPEDPTDLKGIIENTIESEACAIQAYNNLAKKTLGRDHVTYQLAAELLEDEVGDEEEFENLLSKL